MTTFVLLLTAAYRIGVSPLLHQLMIIPSGCRFEPTCSAYGAETLRQYGLFRGSVLLLRRVVNCHPWSRRALYDPPPTTPESAAESF